MKKLEFRGSRNELQQVVKQLNGVMDTGNHFHCIQRIQNVSRPSGISFRFDCAISETKSGFTVAYRVGPTFGTLFLPMILLLVLAACIIAAAVYGESWLYSGIFSTLFIVSITILVACQQKCTRRFLRVFEKQSAQKKHF